MSKESIKTFDFMIDMAVSIEEFCKVYHMYPKTMKVDTEHYRALQEHGNHWIHTDDNNNMVFSNVVIIEENDCKGNFMIMK